MTARFPLFPTNLRRPIFFNLMKKRYLLLPLACVLAAIGSAWAQPCTNPINFFPYYEGFDSGPNGWVATGTNSSWALGSPNKTTVQGAISAPNAWVTGLTAPYQDNDDSRVTSPCFDFSTLTAPIVEMSIFWNTEANYDGAVLQSSTNNGVSWQVVGALNDPDNWYNNDAIIGEPGGQRLGWSGRDNGATSGSGGWVTARHALTGLAGRPNVRLRIAFASDGSAVDDGFGFDNIQVYEASTTDVGVTSIASPLTGTTCSLSAQTVSVRLKNYGTAAQSSIPVSYSVNNGAPVTAVYTGLLPPGGTALFTFPTQFTPPASGVYVFRAQTDLPNDGNANNDAAPSPVTYTLITPIGAFPYSQDFESGSGGWSTGGVRSSWALGTPNKTIIQGAASGANAWVTSLTGTYGASENSFVVSPCFDFSALTLPVVELKIWWNAASETDGAVLQSTINGGGSWQTIGAVNDPDNWYNSDDISSNPGGQSSGWTGDGNGFPTPIPGSGGYVVARHEMPQLAGQAGVRFRIAFASSSFSAGQGIAFDDFRLYEPAPNDVGVTELVAPLPSSTCAVSPQTVTVRLRNYGTATQTNIPVSYSVNGNPVTENFTGSLAPGTTALFTFSTTFTAPGQGTYVFTATTALATDANLTNNAAPTSATYSVIFPISTLPYSENFENGAGGWVSGGTNSSWALGTPNKSNISAAASGQNAWVTALTGDYNQDEDSYVISPCFDFTNIPLPLIEMQIAWQAVSGDDGAVLQSSLDGGITWQVVGAVNDPDNWYNDGAISAAPGGQSIGWTGNDAGFPTPTPSSGGFVLARHVLTGLGGRPSVRLRIAFASNAFGADAGFAFDDVRIIAITPPPPPPPPAVNDLSVSDMLQPSSGCGLTSQELVTVILTNRGTASQSNIPVTVTFTRPGGGTQTLTRVVAGPVGSGVSVPVFFTQQQDLSARGCYNFQAYATLATDEVRPNDTVRIEVCNLLIAVTPTTPYQQTFEAAGHGWSQRGGGRWALGTPAKSNIQGAASGNRAWVSAGLGTNRYSVTENSSVVSPCFDISSLTNPVVELKIWYETESQVDGAAVQVSTNNGSTWATVGVFNGAPNLLNVNWYNSGSVSAQPGGTPNGWTGSSRGYIVARHTLLGTPAQSSSSVRFRVVLAAIPANPISASDVNDGVAFDDFAVYQAQDADVAILGVGPIGAACGFSSSETIAVRVRNQGTQPVSTFPISYRIDNGAVVNTTVTANLLPNQEITLVFPQRANLSAITTCATITVTANVPGDQIAFNNSLAVRVCSTPTTNIPAAVNFDAAGDLSRFDVRAQPQARVSLVPGRGNNSTNGLLLTGAGGSWIDPIGPGNDPWQVNTSHLASASLCVKPGNLPAGTPIRLAFNLRQVSSGAAGLFANVNFRVLVNGVVVGQANYQPNPASPASGSFRWLSFDISSFRNGANNIIVQLQSSVNRNFSNGLGDANIVDDLVVDAGVGVAAPSPFAQGVSVFPNPSSGIFHVGFDHAGAHAYTLTVADLSGRTVRTQHVRSVGHTEAEVDLTALSRGTYLLHVTDSEGNRTTRKITLD